MKGILIFFTLAFMVFGGVVFFYETQIAGPRAGAILKRQQAKPKQAEKVEMDTPSPKVVSQISRDLDIILPQQKDSRIIDLNTLNKGVGADTKEQLELLETLDKSIRKTIKETIRVDIQKAVATEMSKQR